MKSRGFNLGLFLIFWVGNMLGQSFTPESVPNVKIQNNSYISDPSKILDEATYNQINTTLSFLEDSVGSEIALVLLPSIGELVPKDFAYDLFKLWCDGKTGYPFIDANMIELKLTGFMSNRGR